MNNNIFSKNLQFLVNCKNKKSKFSSNINLYII